MCADCFEEGIYRFESQFDFDVFENVLQSKLSEKKLEIIDESGSWEALSSRLYYKCCNCDTTWSLSIPENAWRGYFLREPEAIEYHDRLRVQVKKNAKSYIYILVLLIVAVILWFII